MRTALLHYWLMNMRGGEKVLAALGEMFSEADVFTHAYIPSRISRLIASVSRSSRACHSGVAIRRPICR